MPVTVLNEDSATIVSDDADSPRRFSWSAAFAGAFVAVGVTFLLVTLGSGVGLSLVSVRHATTGGAVTFLTLGAVYFLAAQAFGFAAGGHIAGRLIGPAIETDREEEFRAGTHGLVAWAIAVVATATLVALSVLVAGSATLAGPLNGALAATSGSRGDSATPAATSYYVDKLFRTSVDPQSASLAWRQYAQADTGTANDGTPANADPTTLAPGESTPPLNDATAPRSAAPVFLGGASPAAATAPVATPRSLGADKAEAGRILTVGMADGGRLSAEDRAQLAQIVADDTGLSRAAARTRVDRIEARVHNDETNAAELARKTAAYAGLWTAFALLFGAIVAIYAAISARWEDDREALAGA